MTPLRSEALEQRSMPEERFFDLGDDTLLVMNFDRAAAEGPRQYDAHPTHASPGVTSSSASAHSESLQWQDDVPELKQSLR
jgi:lipopolysaccharide biosynthesis glycosyltransferase